MERIIEFKVQRKIESIPIPNGNTVQTLHAFRDTIVKDNGQVISSVEGVADISRLNKVKYDQPIQASKLALYKADILAFVRNNEFSELYNKARDFYIEKPYSYLSEKGMEGVALLNVNFSDHNIYDITGKKFPKAIWFDYTDGSLHNGKYDLEKALEVLKNRTDVKILSNGITSIPSYNADCYHDMYIECLWIPSDENWARVIEVEKGNNLLTRTHMQKEFILEQILGIIQLPEKTQCYY